MPKWINTYSVLFALITSIVGGVIAFDAHYAKAQALQRLELRVDQKILVDRQDRVQERIWKYEDRYQALPQAPPTEREQWRKLLEEQKQNEKDLDLIKQKTMEKK